MSAFTRARVGQSSFTLPGRYYTSDAVFAHEQERIFARSWLLVGRAEQISAPGAYMLADVAGENLIVVRGKDAAVRALYNVCRHRGTRMCSEQSGRFASSIQCPYHAWTYGLDGALLAARHMQDVPGFDRDDYPLRRAELAEWEGFLFVNLAPEPAPFEAAYAPLLGKFAAWDIANLRVAKRIDYDLACNWKLIVQNYSECYHCPLIHPELERLSESTSGRNDMAAGPFLGGYMTLNTGFGSMTLSGREAAPPVGSVDGADVERVYYYSLFPNVLLSLHADYVMVHTLRPVSAARTLVSCEWLFAPGVLPENVDDAAGFWDMTNRQDWHVSELTQLGVASRAYTPGPYAHAEGLLHAFDQHYLAMLGETSAD
jgi:Rieske 2Fe-2S family protein